MVWINLIPNPNVLEFRREFNCPPQDQGPHCGLSILLVIVIGSPSYGSITCKIKFHVDEIMQRLNAARSSVC